MEFDLKVKSLIMEILTGVLVSFVIFLIIVDEIANNANLIASSYGYAINLTDYTNVSVTADYMKILAGFIVIYGQIGGIIESFLGAHLSEVLAFGFNKGDPARFFFSLIFPFIGAAIFIGLMSRNSKEYLLSSVIATIVTPIIGYAFNPSNIVYLGNAIEVALIGFAVGLIPGLFFNIFGSRMFEEGEEESVKEIEVDIDLNEEVEVEDLEV